MILTASSLSRSLSVFTRVGLVALLIPYAAHSQTFEWVASGGGAQSDKTRAVNVDRQGNVLLVGEANGDLKFGEITVPGAGSSDCFIAKASPDGKFLWAKSLGGSLVDRGYGVAADAEGNLYVTGHHQSTDAKALGQALPNAGDYDVFVAKYSPAGELLWVRTAGGSGYDYGHGIAVDSKGDIVVTGAVVGPAKFGETVLTGTRPIFCAKYDASGRLLWVKGTEGKAACSGHGVALDAADNIYLGGMVSGTGTFAGRELTAGRETHALVAKLNSQGEVQWLSTVPGAPSAVVHEITADAAGTVWVAGIFKGRLQAGDKSWTTTGDKDSDGWVAQFGTDGKLKWCQTLQGAGTDYLLGVAPNGTGGVLVTGESSPGALLAGRQKLEGTARTSVLLASLDGAGALQWHQLATGDKAGNAYTIVADGKGAAVLGGAAMAPTAFGKVPMGATQGADAYAVKVRLK